MNKDDTLDRLPEVQQTNKHILDIAAMAITLPIDETNYKDASHIYKEMDRAITAWETYIDPKVDAANKIHKEMTKMRNEIRGPLEDMKIKVNAYLVKCDAYFEAKAAEDSRRTQVMMRNLQDQSLISKAEIMNDSGFSDMAESSLDGFNNTPVSFISEKIKPENISFRRTYYAEVVDLKLLLEAVLSGKVPMMAIQANMGFINNQARNLKFELPKIYPGLIVRELKTGVSK